jgi:hypothetical protein
MASVIISENDLLHCAIIEEAIRSLGHGVFVQPSGFLPRLDAVLHMKASGHSGQRGFRALQNSRPNEIRLTCSENLTLSGIFSCNRSMSCLLHTPFLEVHLIQPNRWQILQQ